MSKVTKMNRIVSASLVLLVTFVISQVTAATSNATTPIAFCTNQGGRVQMYRLYSGTPGSNALAIGYPMQVCSIPNESGSNSYKLALDTLVSPYPTLAVLAFNSRTPYTPPNSTFSINPSGLYCTQLGGIVSVNLNLGWWPLNQSQADFGQSDFCVFPDRSSMDPWMLFYHMNDATSAGKVRFGYVAKPNKPISLFLNA